MSTYLRDETSRLDSLTDKVIEHLIKIWLFPRYHSVSDWIEHTWKALHKTHKIKDINKFPDSEDIFQNTWEDNKHIVPDTVDHYIRKHFEDKEYPGYMRSNYKDLKNLNNCMEKYFMKISDKLSEDGTFSRSFVEESVVDSGFLDVPSEDIEMVSKLYPIS